MSKASIETDMRDYGMSYDDFEDPCEWEEINKNKYVSRTHAETFDSRILDWKACPYCERRIRIVPGKNK